eukprot:399367-Rhodomonas_salina.1
MPTTQAASRTRISPDPASPSDNFSVQFFLLGFLPRQTSNSESLMTRIKFNLVHPSHTDSQLSSCT